MPSNASSPPAARVAVLADVHGNATALEAVLDEAERERPDVLVHCGDLTWGAQPGETLRLLSEWPGPILFVRGNADRRIGELALGSEAESAREPWLLSAHDPDARATLATFSDSVSLAIEGLGRVDFFHGSPRGDTELVTRATPEERLSEALAGVDADVVVTAHTHMQYERSALGRRFLSPGSVGLPNETSPGAYWALLGPDVSLRRAEYDLELAIARWRGSGDPDAERMVELLRSPPAQSDVIAYAERVMFSE